MKSRKLILLVIFVLVFCLVSCKEEKPSPENTPQNMTSGKLRRELKQSGLLPMTLDQIAGKSKLTKGKSIR